MPRDLVEEVLADLQRIVRMPWKTPTQQANLLLKLAVLPDRLPPYSPKAAGREIVDRCDQLERMLRQGIDEVALQDERHRERTRAALLALTRIEPAGLRGDIRERISCEAAAALFSGRDTAGGGPVIGVVTNRPTMKIESFMRQGVGDRAGHYWKLLRDLARTIVRIEAERTGGTNFAYATLARITRFAAPNRQPDAMYDVRVVRPLSVPLDHVRVTYPAEQQTFRVLSGAAGVTLTRPFDEPYIRAQVMLDLPIEHIDRTHVLVTSSPFLASYGDVKRRIYIPDEAITDLVTFVVQFDTTDLPLRVWYSEDVDSRYGGAGFHKDRNVELDGDGVAWHTFVEPDPRRACGIFWDWAPVDRREASRVKRAATARRRPRSRALDPPEVE